MELYQIRYFLAVSRTLNFTQAAEACHVTQPALTRAIKKLEDEFGGELFRRERKNSHLTELGKAMAPFLQQSHDAAIAAKTEAENYGRGEVVPLRLGLSETVSSELFKTIFLEMQQAVAGLNLSLLRRPADEVCASLQAGEIDFGILSAHDDLARTPVRIWPLFDEEFVYCSASDRHSKISFGDLEGSVIISRPYCENRQTIQAQLDAANVSAQDTHVVSSDADIASLIAAKDIGALLPRSSADRLGLTWVDLEAGPVSRTVALIETAGRQHNKAASRFLRLMRAANWSAGPASQSLSQARTS